MRGIAPDRAVTGAGRMRRLTIQLALIGLAGSLLAPEAHALTVETVMRTHSAPAEYAKRRLLSALAAPGIREPKRRGRIVIELDVDRTLGAEAFRVTSRGNR